MIHFSLWDILLNLLLAARWTIALSLAAFVLGGVLGLVLLFARTSTSLWLRRAASLHIELFQGTPLLMQLFLAFFGLSLIGVETSAWSAAVVALTLWASAFLAEIWRGCVEGIQGGQWDASASQGMSYLQQMCHVVLPQALRIAIPPTVGFATEVIKGTALTSIIGFVELSKASSMVSNASFMPFTVYGTAALIYFALCLPLSMFSRQLDRKLHDS